MKRGRWSPPFHFIVLLVMDYDRRSAALRLFLSMSLSDAKVVLGFPPNSNPTPAEVSKAYRTKSFENHPDRGGSSKKMVEINVAKDILQGKREEDNRPREEDEEERRQREDAERKRKAAEDLAEAQKVIQFAVEQSTHAFNMALSSLSDLAGPSWAPDLKSEVLTDKFAEAADALHDAAEQGIKTTTDAKDKRLWNQIITGCQKLTSDALRLASKFGAFKKKVGKLTDTSAEPTVAEIEVLTLEGSKFASNFKVFYEDVRKMSKVIGYVVPAFPGDIVDENEVVPPEVVEGFQAAAEALYSANEHAKAFSEAKVRDRTKLIEKHVEAVLRILALYGITSGFPDWTKWVMEDYKKAEEAVLKKSKTAGARRSTTQRVAIRFF